MRPVRVLPLPGAGERIRDCVTGVDVFFRRPDKGMKQLSAVFIRPEGELRVPLDGPHETPVRHVRSLNDPVRSDGHSGPCRRQRFDRLVMIAVDRERTVSQQRCEGRRRERRHGVDRHVIRRTLVMFDRRWMLAWQILIQRPAQRRVDELYAPADPEDGFIMPQCSTVLTSTP